MNNSKTVAFVCLHGSAKSLIAAEYFTRLAKERGIDARGTTSGPEPDSEIPINVIEGLRDRGIDVANKRPVLVNADALARAEYIVSFGCDPSKLVAPERQIEQWDDWRFITAHVQHVLERMGV